jgi:hypothetical protein
MRRKRKNATSAITTRKAMLARLGVEGEIVVVAAMENPIIAGGSQPGMAEQVAGQSFHCHNARMTKSAITAAVLLMFTICVAAEDKKSSSDGLANLYFSVIKDDNEKPVRNASVILHPVGKNGKQSKGGYQLKTDNDGKTQSEGVPYGTLRVQVIAHGFQTFGDDYQISQPSMKIDIRLKRPQDQFTIYDKPGEKPQSPGNETPQTTPK